LLRCTATEVPQVCLESTMYYILPQKIELFSNMLEKAMTMLHQTYKANTSCDYGYPR